MGSGGGGLVGGAVAVPVVVEAVGYGGEELGEGEGLAGLEDAEAELAALNLPDQDLWFDSTLGLVRRRSRSVVIESLGQRTPPNRPWGEHGEEAGEIVSDLTHGC